MGGNPSRVKVTGPLVPYVAGFHTELKAQGYRPNALSDQLRLMAHVSRVAGIRRPRGRGADARADRRVPRRTTSRWLCPVVLGEGRGTAACVPTSRGRRSAP